MANCGRWKSPVPILLSSAIAFTRLTNCYTRTPLKITAVNKLLYCLLLALPLHRLTVTSGFGWRIHPVTHRLDFHAGVDLRANFVTDYAVMDGSVFAGYNR